MLKKVHKLLLLLALLWGLAPPSTQAQIINYPNGFAGSSGQIFLNNSAKLSGSTIQLVSLGIHTANNAWYKTAVNIQAFTTTFTWKNTCPGSGMCGSGIGFEIICQCSANPAYNPRGGNPGYTYSGYSGEQFSWSQCVQKESGYDCPFMNSALVKFDMYNNNGAGSEGDLTGFYVNGVFPQNPQRDMAPSGINMQSGHLMRATLSYNGTTLYETVIDTVTNATYSTSYPADIPAAIGSNKAFVGFGGGTGAAEFQGNIYSWTYSVESPLLVHSKGWLFKSGSGSHSFGEGPAD